MSDELVGLLSFLDLLHCVKFDNVANAWGGSFYRIGGVCGQTCRLFIDIDNLVYVFIVFMKAS